MITMGPTSYYGKIDNEHHVPIAIGNYCSIASTLMIAGYSHPMGINVSTFPFNEMWQLDYPSCVDTRVTTIGNDVWIGRDVTILQGAMIGDGAIIGANSVIRGTIPEFTIVIGNPALVYKWRFDQPAIEALKKIKWWEWSEQMVRDRIQDFKDVHAFVKKYLPETE
jgi:acetyltransferase-like isoleucine patch superfamily enzyme